MSVNHTRGCRCPQCVDPKVAAEMDDEALTPEAMDAFKERIERIRVDIFCAESAGLSPMAEQHVLLALNYLSSAKSMLALAKYHQMRKD